MPAKNVKSNPGTPEKASPEKILSLLINVFATPSTKVWAKTIGTVAGVVLAGGVAVGVANPNDSCENASSDIVRVVACLRSALNGVSLSSP